MPGSRLDRLNQLRNSRESTDLFDGLKRHLTSLFSLKDLSEKKRQKELEKCFTDSINKLNEAVNQLPKQYAKSLTEEIDRLSDKWEELNETLTSSENTQKIVDAIDNIEFPEVIIPESVTVKNLSPEITKLAKYLQIISKKEVIFPEIQKVEGKVDIGKAPFDPRVIQELQALRDSIDNIKFPEQKEIKIPSMPKEIGMREAKDIKQALVDVKESLDRLYEKEQPEFPNSVEVTNFPPQKTPQPVTHINILPLNGGITTRSITVDATATALPPDPAESRRSIMIFNNDASSTVFIGGSDVTPDNGFPVTSQSFSPVIDAGVKTLLYGITSSGSIDVRVIEVSMETGRRET